MNKDGTMFFTVETPGLNLVPKHMHKLRFLNIRMMSQDFHVVPSTSFEGWGNHATGLQQIL